MQDLKWRERYAWYHFNYNEVFNYTDEDFEREAAAYKERGITTLITFGGTHFVFSYEPYWEDIFACVGRIVRAFHKYGIKVIEHRSYSLAGHLVSEADWEASKNYHPWPGMKEHVFSNYLLHGVPVESMAQVDGRTGLPQICCYRSYCLCPNNPDYKALLQYFAGRMFDLGVDGMMNDDIEYHPNACACEHCRKKFKEETGYDLPTPEHWDEFYENYDNPAYIAWKQFKVRSSTQCLDEIVALERAKGLPKLLRPVYACTVLPQNVRNSIYETGLRHFTNYFQENFRPGVVRYCYPHLMAESLDRYARAERFGIPSMSLFYPYTTPLIYFSWALSHTWGQMYTGTVHDADITAQERPYREFETKYQDWLGASKKCADLAVYQSLLTREGRPRGGAHPTINLMTASNFSGLMTDMVFDDDTVETLSRYPVIALNCVSMMTDEHIAKLRAYAENGGTLLLIGDCGAYNEKVEKRTPADVMAMFGLKTPVISCDEKKNGVFTYGGKTVSYDDMRTTCCFDAPDGILKSGDTVLGVEETVGAGKILCLLPQLDACENEFYPTIEFRDKNKPHPVVPPSIIPGLRKTTGVLLRAIVGTPKVEAKCDDADLLVTMYKVEAGHAVHITNISETFTSEQKSVWHEDPLLGFDGGYRIPCPIDISISYEGEAKPSVTLHTTEQDTSIALDAVLKDGRLSFTVPADTFGGYAMIAIK